MRWWQPVEPILEEWESVDGAAPGYWEDFLADKRCDWHYEQLRAELTYVGWNGLLTCGYRRPNNRWIFGDGHHRLAIALEQGWPVVPVRYTGSFPLIARDSGDGDWTSRRRFS